MFGLGHTSVDRYIRALAVCNSLAELASQGGEDEFFDHLRVLVCLKKYWTQGHPDAKVVCDEAKGETIDETQLAVEIQNISLENILSHDSVTESQRVLVLCGKIATSNAAGSNLHQETECYSVFPSLLTMPSACAREFLISFQ